MRRPFLFWGFKSSKEVLENSLGALEREVMAVAWDRGEINVRDACARLRSPAAYTTVMTTMERLHRKGVLERRKDGRAFSYKSVKSRDEMERGLVTNALEPLLRSGSAQPILSCLVDEVSRHDERLLDELERLVREKRRQQEDR